MENRKVDPDLDINELVPIPPHDLGTGFNDVKRSELDSDEAEIAKFERNLQNCRKYWSIPTNPPPPGRICYLNDELAKQGWWGVLADPAPWKTFASTCGTEFDDSVQVASTDIVSNKNIAATKGSFDDLKIEDVNIGNTDFSELIGKIDELNFCASVPFYRLVSPGLKDGKVIPLYDLFGPEERNKWDLCSSTNISSVLPEDGLANQENVDPTHCEKYSPSHGSSEIQAAKRDLYEEFSIWKASDNSEAMKPTYNYEEFSIPHGCSDTPVTKRTLYEAFSVWQASDNHKTMKPTYNNEKHSKTTGSIDAQSMKPKFSGEYSMWDGLDNFEIKKPTCDEKYSLPLGSNLTESLKTNCYEENSTWQGSDNHEIMKPAYIEVCSMPQGVNDTEIMRANSYDEYSLWGSYSHEHEALKHSYCEKYNMSLESGNFELAKAADYKDYSMPHGSDNYQIVEPTYYEEYSLASQAFDNQIITMPAYEEFSMQQNKPNNQGIMKSTYEEYSKGKSFLQGDLLQRNGAVENPIGTLVKEWDAMAGNSKSIVPDKPKGFQREITTQPFVNAVYLRQRQHYEEGSGCSFCIKCPRARSLGWWEGHVLRCDGKVICPMLRGIVCHKCHATGDIAHTIGHCPAASDTEKNQVRAYYRKLAHERKNKRVGEWQDR